jgi:hypothetical protein
LPIGFLAQHGGAGNLVEINICPRDSRTCGINHGSVERGCVRTGKQDGTTAEQQKNVVKR